jgi:hypothetical protein
MKVLITFGLMILILIETNAQTILDSLIINSKDSQTDNLESNLVREINLKIDGRDINLSNDFQIQMINNLNKISILPLDKNNIKLPCRFPGDSTYCVIFIFKDYELIFDNISGSNFNYKTVWKFDINNPNLTNTEKINSWTFEPNNSDGWIIEAKTCNKMTLDKK